MKLHKGYIKAINAWLRANVSLAALSEWQC